MAASRVNSPPSEFTAHKSQRSFVYVLPGNWTKKRYSFSWLKFSDKVIVFVSLASVFITFSPAFRAAAGCCSQPATRSAFTGSISSLSTGQIFASCDEFTGNPIKRNVGRNYRHFGLSPQENILLAPRTGCLLGMQIDTKSSRQAIIASRQAWGLSVACKSRVLQARFSPER
jgi:hypothetical protein